MSGWSGRFRGCSSTTWSIRRRCRGRSADGDEVQRVTDYIAGMTDRFCIAAFRRLALPEESRL